MGRARDISKVFSTGTALATDTEVSAFNYLTQSSASTVYQTKAATGLTLLTPTSIANTSGTASIGTNGTITFNGVTSVSLNDVFSSTYDNYKIIVTGNTSITSATGLLMRLRVSGADNTSSNYRWSTIYARDNAAAPTVGAEGSNGTNTYALVGSLSSTAGFTATNTIELANPFVSTKNTSLNFMTYVYDQVATYGFVYTGGAIMSVTTSYTGFTIYAPSGNITGSVSVYGYND
jgi:hypothetical protein